MNSPGYNYAEPQLINAIIANGHTVVVNSTTFTSLPIGFTTTCIDPVNGYDWLCFFGTNNFSSLLPQIQTYIDEGGKVFYQYEVECCATASSSIASILSGLTGLTITPNSNPHIANSGLVIPPGWDATNINCCVDFKGDAYRGLDGLPLQNQLRASSTLNFASPPVTNCLNFGFLFTTTDFVGTANKGAIVGIGDINIWYNGDEPLAFGVGVTPINVSIVNVFFPNNTSTCYFIPPGCLQSYITPSISINLGEDITICEGESITLNLTTDNGSYLWQDSTTSPFLTITEQGTYWAKVINNCGIGHDTINVETQNCELILEMPNTFTPNGDGINDNFFPIEINAISKATLIIYNRWGQKLFESNNIEKGWDGKYNDSMCVDGVYYWILDYTDLKDTDFSKTGFLNLVR